MWLDKPAIDIDNPGWIAWKNSVPVYRVTTPYPFFFNYFSARNSYLWMADDSWIGYADAMETLFEAVARD